MSRPLTFILCMLILAGACRAQTPRPPTPLDPNADINAITRQLARPSPAEQDAAIASIREMLERKPARATVYIRVTWLKSLMDAKRFADADDLALRAILASPAETGSIEALMQFRIRAALAQGKADFALAHAKSLFNLSSMANTSTAMLLVAECLNASHPGDASAVNRFKAEQMAAARLAAPGTAPATLALYAHPRPGGSPTLAAIHVDGPAYTARLSEILAEDFTTLVSRGNLLLLADRPADALDAFERAYSLATEGQLPSATEAIARCMKAQDGTVGRANEWVLSLRPKTGGGK